MGFGFIVFVLLLLVLLVPAINGESIDAQALLSLKGEIDPLGSLQWDSHSSSSLCSSWDGVKGCIGGGRVTKLVLEFLNLTGTLKSEALAPLDQLRVLSFKSNSLFGPIPDLSPLHNLKSLYLSNNRFSGGIPGSLSSIHRLKIIVLSDNLLTGEIPASFAQIPRLYTLYLQNNRLTGQIPSFGQSGLRFFNVSSNNLSGGIPDTKTLSQFNVSSFINTPGLCGPQIKNPCPKNLIFPPSTSPASHRKSKKRLAIILSCCIAGFALLLVVACIAVKRKRRRKGREAARKPAEGAAEAGGDGGAGEGGGEKREFSWENDGLGKLVFCGGGGEMYSLEDLLKASAETLGRGAVGSTYKAVMVSGFIVTVKRLKDSGHLGVEEFRRSMEELGRLRHPNLVPLRAYFQAREERLLVYDYFPNGSLFSLIHGSRATGSGKPLHWTSCLKIAEDVATGLLYLHQSNCIHGNLKSSNVLLGSDFESCLTDYGLLPVLCSGDESSSTATTTSSSTLFYRAPECRSNKSTFTPQSDTYSLGVLLLELLTGKTPFQDLVEEHGADIPRWVRSVREDETESGGDESSEEKLGVLLNIAMACIAVDAERRPVTKDVVRMIKEARAEVVVSSNSSDHSPGRWSDTVQSLPREYGSEHLGFAERD